MSKQVDLRTARVAACAPRGAIQRGTLRAELELCLWLADVVIVPVTAVATYISCCGLSPLLPEAREVAGGVVLSAGLTFLLLPVYRGWRARSVCSDLSLVLMAWLSAFAMVALHSSGRGLAAVNSGHWLLYWFLTGAVCLSANHLLLHFRLRWLRSQGLERDRVLMIGLHAQSLKLQRRLAASPGMSEEVIGYFSTTGDVAVPPGRGAPPCLGSIAEAPTYLASNREAFDQVWVSLPLSSGAEIAALFKDLEGLAVPMHIIPDIRALGALNPGVHQVAGVPMIGLRQGLGTAQARRAKRLVDLLVAGFAVVALAPLMVLLACGVVLSSPGPVLFRQPRHGLGGEVFEVFKFRTMRVHVEAGDTLTQATRHDRRVTPFGAFMRRTSLDELPQFFNVLGGSMSVVGPRPHAVQHNTYYEKLIRRYMQRHYVKPGITGWAQVHGLRGETPQLRSMSRRVRYDIDYIRRWSVTLDLKIIATTAIKVLGQKSAC